MECPLSRWTYDFRSTQAGRDYLAWIKATGPTCGWCGHPGSDQADHVIPVSVAPELAGEPSNWRPIHGTRGCPHCPPNPSTDRRRRGQPRRCNQQRGNSLQLTAQTRRSRAW